MECVIAIQFKDFVMIAADQMRTYGIVVMKDDEQKLYKLTDHLVMAVVGEAGDAFRFADYITKNVKLYKLKNKYDMSPSSAAHFTRHKLAEALRTRTPYNVNMVLGGWDKDAGPSLYLIDSLATSVKLPFMAYGIGGTVALSVLDKEHYMDFNECQAYRLMESCISEMHKRLIVNLANFKVVTVCRRGIKMLPDITMKSLSCKKRK